jgi:PAS domain S-box-containing protein
MPRSAERQPERHREEIARITLDSMVQFVGLLDAEGTVLEINHVALNVVGISLADVEGRPFWTTFWWQVSPEINAELREMIRRAAAGEFIRWDTEIYGRAGGKETIVIDASLMPVKDEHGTVVFIAPRGATSPRRRPTSGRSPASVRSWPSSTGSRPSSSPTSATSSGPR